MTSARAPATPLHNFLHKLAKAKIEACLPHKIDGVLRLVCLNLRLG